MAANLQGVLETKKLDNKLKSPVIHHITSSMTGVNVIRSDRIISVTFFYKYQTQRI
jgi:hypothetical protein